MSLFHKQIIVFVSLSQERGEFYNLIIFFLKNIYFLTKLILVEKLVDFVVSIWMPISLYGYACTANIVSIIVCCTRISRYICTYSAVHYDFETALLEQYLTL